MAPTKRVLKACLLLTTSSVATLAAEAASQAAATGGDFSDMFSQFIPSVASSTSASSAESAGSKAESAGSKATASEIPNSVGKALADQDCLRSPELCKTKADLDAWREATLADIQKAPEAVRSMVQTGIESKYAKRLSELSDTASQEVSSLDAWKNEQLKQIATLQTSAQATALALLDQEVKRRRAALAAPHTEEQSQVAAPPTPLAAAPQVAPQGLAATAPEPPACLLRAEACNSERELRAWRVTKLTWIREQVPFDQQAVEVEGVRSDYEKRRAELLRTAQSRNGNRSEATPAPPSGATAVIAAAEASSPESASRMSSTFLYCAAGLLLPALLAGLAGGLRKPAKKNSKRPGHDQETLYMALEEAA